jgi:ATP-dependent Clp protease protease subunit
MNYHYQEFEKYAKGHLGISGMTLNHFEKQQESELYSKERTGMMTPMILEEREMRVSIMSVFDRLMRDRILWVAGPVNDYMSTIVQAQLMFLDSISDADIKMHIDSPGGSVKSGLSIVDVMEYINANIITVNTGLAASMAATILCSGTKGKRKALKRSRTMIHQPLSYTGFAQASDIEIDAKHINSIKTELYEIISDRTGQPYDKVQKDGDRDYWMNSSEAKRYGMIDKILDKRK